MDTVLREQWTTERFLAWEDGQDGKHEFDGVRDAVRLTVHARRDQDWETSVVTAGVARLEGVAELAVDGVYAGLAER